PGTAAGPPGLPGRRRPRDAAAYAGPAPPHGPGPTGPRPGPGRRARDRPPCGPGQAIARSVPAPGGARSPGATRMNLTPVTDRVSARSGLDPESLGPTALPRAVASRMRALGLGTTGDYASRLAGDAQEFQALLDDLIVPETWFFRGGEVFAFLGR